VEIFKKLAKKSKDVNVANAVSTTITDNNKNVDILFSAHDTFLE